MFIDSRVISCNKNINEKMVKGGNINKKRMPKILYNYFNMKGKLAPTP